MPLVSITRLRVRSWNTSGILPRGIPVGASGAVGQGQSCRHHIARSARHLLDTLALDRRGCHEIVHGFRRTPHDYAETARMVRRGVRCAGRSGSCSGADIGKKYISRCSATVGLQGSTIHKKPSQPLQAANSTGKRRRELRFR